VRTVVYVDGFNLYYSLLRRTSLKWFDLVALFRDHVLGSNTQLTEVRYYTAPVLARMSDDPKPV
jgi:6-hydroxy-3-succinoylpyridine 3-monooxygenase